LQVANGNRLGETLFFIKILGGFLMQNVKPELFLAFVKLRKERRYSNGFPPEIAGDKIM
jgi:hypothetical protein